jgi:Family of unknown function (DUF5681)
MTDKRSPAEAGDDNVVGYGRPPRHTRFQPERSGNPNGCPKGSKNFSTLFSEELARPVTLTENGKRRRMSKREALAKQIINKALTNDPKAAALVIDQMRRSDGLADGPATIDIGQRENRLVMESIIRRIRTAGSTPPGTRGPDDDPEDSK